MSMENVASLAVLVLVAGVGAQWIAWRTRFPAIVLLAAVGLVLGPVTGVIAGGKELAEQLEQLADQGRLEAALPMLAALESEMRNFAAALTRHLEHADA